MKEKNLDKAINSTVLLCCLLHLMQDIQDKIQESGVKYNQLLKNRSKMYNEELEKELLFLYRSFTNEKEELLFYEKINTVRKKLNDTLLELKIDAI